MVRGWALKRNFVLNSIDIKKNYNRSKQGAICEKKTEGGFFWKLFIGIGYKTL